MRRAAAWLAAVLLVLGLGLVLPSRAVAQTTESIVLTADTPLTTDGSSDLELRGVVTAPDLPADAEVTVRATLQPRLLDTLSAGDDWFAGRSRDSGRQVGETATTAAADQDGRRAFVLTIPAEDLERYDYQLASLPLTITASADGTTVATERLALQVQTSPAQRPIRTDLVVPLTLPADPDLFGPRGAARDAAWRRAIGPGSRIDELLTRLQGHPVTWVVDPAVVDPPAPADPNLPAADDTGDETTGTPTTDPSPTSPTASPTAPGEATDGDQTSAEGLVTALKKRLAELPQEQTVWWTPWGDPDLTTLARYSPAALERSFARALPKELREISTTRVLVPEGTVDSTTLRRITGVWAKKQPTQPVAVLPAAGVPDSSGKLSTSERRITGTSGVLLADDSLSSLLATGNLSVAERSARILSRTVALYQQAPGSERSTTLVVPRNSTISPGDLSSVVTSLSAASWVRSRPADRLQEALKSAPTATLSGRGAALPSASARPQAAVFDASTRDWITAERRRLDRLNSVLIDSDDVVGDRMAALDVAASTRWRGHRAALNAVINSDAKGVDSLESKLYVNPSTVNFFADSGKLSITVVNDLNRPVRDLDLAVQPRKNILRLDGATEPFSLRANSRTVIQTPVTATAPGDVAIDVNLRNASGDAVGRSDGRTQLNVAVRPTSTWIYWVVGIVAGLVLVLGLTRALRQGLRVKNVDPTGGSDDPADSIVATEDSAPVPDEESPDPGTKA